MDLPKGCDASGRDAYGGPAEEWIVRKTGKGSLLGENGKKPCLFMSFPEKERFPRSLCGHSFEAFGLLSGLGGPRIDQLLDLILN